MKTATETSPPSKKTTAGKPAARKSTTPGSAASKAAAAKPPARGNRSPDRSANAPGKRAAKAAAVARARRVAPDIKARYGSTPATKFRGNPDLFGRLVEDHDKHRMLFAMIAETRPGSPERKRLFREIVRDIKGHAAAEEQALWAAVLRNPDTTEYARHAVAEHHEMDEMLADLAARDQGSPGWLRRLSAVRDEYLHHIREEEQEQFVKSEKHLSTAESRHLRQVFNARKRAEKAAVKIEKKIKLKRD